MLILKQIYNNDGSSTVTAQMFKFSSFAWQLLQWEIAIEMNQNLQGQAIAKLLELYMKGVQVMNSNMDIRQSYFKNKVTTLMMKNNVVKTLNQSPMTKKQNHLQSSTQKDTNKDKKSHRKNIKAQQQSVSEFMPKIQKLTAESYVLRQKKKQIQMRVTYESSSSSNQKLSQLLDFHKQKEEKYQSKVKNLIDQQEERFKQRVRKRHLKTIKCHSRIDATNDSSSKQVQQTTLKKDVEEPFLFELHTQKLQKRCKSVNTSRNNLSQTQNQKRRKYTLDSNHLTSWVIPKQTQVKNTSIKS